MARLGVNNIFSALELAGQEDEEPASQPGGRGGAVSGARRGRAKRLSGRKWLGGDPMTGDWLPLRIASYNVLAKCYAKQKHFTACKLEHLKWSERRAALIEVIDELDADILCLQEVEDYDKFWKKELSSRGYSGMYKKRNSDRKYDGCATFFRSSKFEKVDMRGLEFDDVDASECLPDFDTHNVALLTVLRPRWRSGGCFCVANTHLFWDPSYEELKICQAKALVRAAGEVSAVHGDVPIILAGDFNSVPESCVYKFLTSEANFTSAYAQVSSLKRPPTMGLQSIEGGNGDSHAAQAQARTAASVARTEAFVTGPKLIFARALNPDSPVFSPGGTVMEAEPVASAELGALGEQMSHTGEPAFTNYRDIFNGAIDFIFYRGNCVHARACLGMIGEADARKEGGGLPNSRHPSDHLPIAVDLALTFD